MRKRICIITPGHVASAPRVVKEADALAKAGYQVHVISGSHYAPAVALDDTVLSRAAWDGTILDARSGLGPFARRVLRKILLAVASRHPHLLPPSLQARALHAETARLAAAALKIRADLYIGHCVPGLYAAATAAQCHGVCYGFDMEDFHEAETEATMRHSVLRDATAGLCKSLIPGARHLTAASPLMAEACQHTYGANPVTLLNVFPLAEAPECQPSPVPPDNNNPLKLYWFSQTVGEGRGLENIIRALSLMQHPAELHLRGECSPEYRKKLERLIAGLTSRHSLIFLPSGPPAEMVRLCTSCHVGLSVEIPHPLNKDICLGNKIFTYLLAGLPVLMTPTRAQRQLHADLGDASILLDLAGDPAGSATALDSLCNNPHRLKRAGDHAWHLAQTRYNWDFEQQSLLDSVARALSTGH